MRIPLFFAVALAVVALVALTLFMPGAAFAQGVTGVILTPEVWGELTSLAVTVMSLAVTILSLLASAFLPGWAKAIIDEKARKSLHEAAMTWAETAMTQGLTAANAGAGASFAAYAEQSVPDALRRLTPSPEVLLKIARRYLTK